MVLIYSSGAFQVHCKHIEKKKNTWYYRRRIPEDCRKLHRKNGRGQGPPQLFFSLKTGDEREACRLADAHTRRLDGLWKAHRAGQANPNVSLAQLEAYGLEPGDSKKYPDNPHISDVIDDLAGRSGSGEPEPRISAQDRMTLDILMTGDVPRTLSDAKAKHIELGKLSLEPKQQAQFERAWNILIGITGDIMIDQLRREHANEFVRKVIAMGKGPEGNGPSTVRRYLSQVRPVITTGIREFDLNVQNPFEGVTIPNQKRGQTKPRRPFSGEQLERIQTRCREVNDQRRWVLSVLSDTGARLAEIACLRKEDVSLSAEIPHIHITPYDGHRLKTEASQRKVPLVGEALWAVKQAMQSEGALLFSSLASRKVDEVVNCGSLSAALNKWLRENELAGVGQTCHGFRHSMRDRLRGVETPADISDAIGGWATTGVGESYGQGHGLPVMAKYLRKVVAKGE